MEGKSLVPAFENRTIARDALFWEHEGNRAVRVANWKLVAKGPAGKWELYDIDKDRSELHDLAAQEAEKVASMKAKWEGYAQRANVLPWIWEPAYGHPESEASPKASRLLHFELKEGAHLDGSERPDIANRSLQLTVELEGPLKQGVLVAQGGTVDGYSLYVKNDNLCWAVRRDHKLAVVTAEHVSAANAHKIQASLDRDGTLKLLLDSRDVAAGKAGGLIPKLPADGLQVGEDLKGAVGEYPAPFTYEGKIQSALLELGPAD
jgi:arylsulfatase